MELNDTFTFGKYKGQTLQAVIEDNPFYVEWCIKNIPVFKISESAEIELEYELIEIISAFEQARNDQRYKD